MKKQVKVKSPNFVIYLLVYLFINPILKVIFSLKVDKRLYQPIDGPCIVLANHTSFLDFLIVMMALYPLRLNAVAAQKFFFYRPLNKLLPVMGCIPKNLFDPDPRAIKSIHYVLNQGGSILMFPEGRCSVDGDYMGMHAATGKLIKLLKVPVISCHIDGAYACLPLWRRRIRFGKINVTIQNMLSSDQVKGYPPDVINDVIADCLNGSHKNSHDRKTRAHIGFHLARGLENMLYFCPNCHEEFTTMAGNNCISCRNCGISARVKRDGSLVPRGAGNVPMSVGQWYQVQVDHERELLKQKIYPTDIPVKVRTQNKKGHKVTSNGKGFLSFNPEGWHYVGTLHGEEVDLFFPIATVPCLPFDPADNFQIYSDGIFLAFSTITPRDSVKYATLGEVGYWLYVKNSQMIQGPVKRF